MQHHTRNQPRTWNSSTVPSRHRGAVQFSFSRPTALSVWGDAEALHKASHTTHCNLTVWTQTTATAAAKSWNFARAQYTTSGLWPLEKDRKPVTVTQSLAFARCVAPHTKSLNAPTVRPLPDHVIVCGILPPTTHDVRPLPKSHNQMMTAMAATFDLILILSVSETQLWLTHPHFPNPAGRQE